MVNLLSLPDELLHIIILEHVLTTPVNNLESEPFSWVAVTKRASKHTFRQCNTLYNVILACKRFHSIFNLFLYVQPDLLRHISQLANFKRTISKSPELGYPTDVVATSCPSAYEVVDVFWLPYITTITLRDFNDWEPVEWEGNSHIHSQSVEALNLINCGAHEAALTEILRWPKALTTLFYEANQGEWYGRLEGEEEPVGWQNSAFKRAISPQKKFLEKLVMTRVHPDHEGLGYSDFLDLSSFTSLRILHVHHVFLNAFEFPHMRETTHTRLPPSLVEFQVLYDDTGYMDFLENYPHWVTSLLKNKNKYLPNLQMVHVWTYENLFLSHVGIYEEKQLTVGLKDTDGYWKIPEEFKMLAIEAHVELKVTLAYKPATFRN